MTIPSLSIDGEVLKEGPLLWGDLLRIIQLIRDTDDYGDSLSGHAIDPDVPPQKSRTLLHTTDAE